MILVRIDDNTGLVSEEPLYDSWKAVKSFNAVFKKYGIKGFTCIALSADYQSVFKHYNNEDRPKRAMDEIYGSRNKLNFEKDELLIAALNEYKEIQFNPDLEQEKINNEIKLRYLKNLSSANTEGNEVDIAKYNKLLQNHEDSIDKFNKRFNKQESLQEALASSGYKLSRIENDILSRKNSKFVNHGSDIENPNKLGLDIENKN